MIEPPKELPPIFVTPQTSDESLQNLAITLSTFPIENREGVQVFEVPKIADDCRSYVGRGYEAYQDTTAKNPQGPAWEPDSTWIKLESNNDFTCRKGFEKVYVYEGHYARQWGDGTILEKLGSTHWGATPVVRLIDPHAPIVKKYYGEVKEIWIRPYQQGLVPIPYLRAQSSYRRGPFGKHHLFKSVYDKKEIVIQRLVKDDWKAHYQWAKKQQQLRTRFFKPEEEKHQESNATFNPQASIAISLKAST
ncbi:CBU_2028 family Dot/Icm T4SS effector [Coxiella burnetii]|uniref:CBU_2028 family Dot/Icm T4SS effector n=1 Tax=Coxiella burnetii TaxID=777 RepID=UPI00217666E3|nr:CBU_2028 family Dot/Icm T4SS effector [Coxiella burnetii]